MTVMTGPAVVCGTCRQTIAAEDAHHLGDGTSRCRPCIALAIRVSGCVACEFRYSIGRSACSEHREGRR